MRIDEPEYNRPAARRHAMGRSARAFAAGLVAAGGLACGVSDERALPPDVQDPKSVQTAAGALAFYHQTVARLPRLFDRLVVDVGVLTDELEAMPVPVLTSGNYTALDSRQDFSGIATAHSDSLHRLRAQAREARGFLAAYAPDSSPALRGHLYALEGYADVFLADLFCSGIPLSTVDFQGDYTLTPGFTTAEVYARAVGLFDSALALTVDDASLRHLASVGRARALLALDSAAQAAAAVSAVPDDYLYQVVYDNPDDATEALRTIAEGYTEVANRGSPRVGDREGATGLDYRSSGDPRTPVLTLETPDELGNTMYFPAKYPTSGPVTFTVASGVEARLIEAEAALRAGQADWLAKLNALRTDGTFELSGSDTLWHPGGGGVPGLGPLGDPGSANARVDLVFRERGFWLYLTAHRQGDLRRLIRQYQRAQDAVFPTGFYPGGSGAYGTEVVVPVPASEREFNPKYTGCFHRNA